MAWLDRASTRVLCESRFGGDKKSHTRLPIKPWTFVLQSLATSALTKLVGDSCNNRLRISTCLYANAFESRNGSAFDFHSCINSISGFTPCAYDVGAAPICWNARIALITATCLNRDVFIFFEALKFWFS